MSTNQVLHIFSLSLLASTLIGAPGLGGQQLAAQERPYQLPHSVGPPTHIEGYGPQCTEAGLFRKTPDTPDPLLLSSDAPAAKCTEERLDLLDELTFLRRHAAPDYQQPDLATASGSQVFLDTELSADSLLDLRLQAGSSPEFGELSHPAAATSRLSPAAETANPYLSVRLQPYATRDFLQATQPLQEFEGRYQISPLDPTDRIYGVGILSDYKVSSWLHLNSSYRFNIHSAGSRRSSSSAQHGGDASHSLFFGITVPFQAPSGEK